jgi:hypothetical protein
MRCADIRAEAGRIPVSKHGGPIFGPFFDDMSLSWVSPLFEDEERFRAGIDGGAWNIGGDRLRLAPELRYNVRDRARFLESYDLQPAVDPGRYRLAEPAPESCRLFQITRLETCDDPASGPKSLRLERLVQPAGDPLRDIERYGSFREHVSFSGNEYIVTLTDLAPDGRESQAWRITQLPPGVRGYSLDIYHDDGGLGGVAEIECHGQPARYPGGVVRFTDQFLTWAYRGKKAVVREACSQLRGTSSK